MNNRFLAALILVVYIGVRFGAIQYLDQPGQYASYVFELAVVLICLGLYRKNFKLLLPRSQSVLGEQ